VKIAVYAPMKNEAKNISAWAESAKDADCIVLADTGSDDGSYDIAAEMGLNPYSICIDPWRFDTAYNTVLALVPEDIDVAICLHLDERLQPGWREELEKVYSPEVGIYTCNYEFAPTLKYRHERIHRRKGFKWFLPAHEVIEGPGTKIHSEVSIVQSQGERDRTQDSALIHLAYEESPNPRTAYYSAREYYYQNDWESSRTLFQKYLNMPDAVYDQERAEACRIMSRMVWPDFRERWLLRACSEAPQRRECWGELAEHYSSVRDNIGALYAATNALKIIKTNPYNSFHIESKYWDEGYLRSLYE
jgi:glycosyltransferase involved in cell wall biosynthesis